MIVLDTHVWIRWLLPSAGRLPKDLRHILDCAEELSISTVSIYELIIAVGRGRLSLNLPLDEWIREGLSESGVIPIAPNETIVHRAGLLPSIHGDPLDRIIIATALCHSAKVASLDVKFSAYLELSGRIIG